VIKRERVADEAHIFENQKETATLLTKSRGNFVLVSSKGGWILTNRVDGEFRPFSMTVRTDDPLNESIILKIRQNLFFHNQNSYLIGNNPEGRPYGDFLLGSKFICRLLNFPFSSLDEIDYEARSMLGRIRGLPVGEIYGIGWSGFHVKIESELEDIGLPLSAVSYLMYSTG
jgi:hypothetical protein